MTSSLDPRQEAGEKALRRCEELIGWYEKQGGRDRRLDVALQTLTIVMAAITPILVMLAIPDWLKAAPAVVVSVAAGLNAAFGFRARHLSFAQMAERLREEKLWYEVRARSSPSPAQDLEFFLARMENAATAQASEWRDRLRKDGPSVSLPAPTRRTAEPGGQESPSSPVRIEWQGHPVGALEDASYETINVDAGYERMSGRWVRADGPRTDAFLEALAKDDSVELKTEHGYVTSFSLDDDGFGRLLIRKVPARRDWDRALRARGRLCIGCSSLSYPLPGTGDRYRCSGCLREFTGAVHDIAEYPNN